MKATAADFNKGTVLIDAGGIKFELIRETQDGVWEARTRGGVKCVFVTEAACYSVGA